MFLGIPSIKNTYTVSVYIFFLTKMFSPVIGSPFGALQRKIKFSRQRSFGIFFNLYEVQLVFTTIRIQYVDDDIKLSKTSLAKIQLFHLSDFRHLLPHVRLSIVIESIFTLSSLFVYRFPTQSFPQKIELCQKLLGLYQKDVLHVQ